MAQTRPTGEQLRFRSENTGDHILDTYMEASEKGGRALFDLLDDIFEPDTGNFAADNFQFRFNEATNQLEVRVGVFSGQDTGYKNITPFFAQRGTFSANTNYKNLDTVVTSTKDVFVVHGLAKDSTVSFNDEASFISSSNTQRIVDVSEARDWASKTDGQVDSTDYSAKAYAVGGQGVDDTIGSAKDWAIKTNATVDGTNFSAKYWATDPNVTTVSTNINDITTVSDDIANVNIAAADISNINTTAGDITNINSVAAELGADKDVTIVATDLEGTDTIGTVALDIANVNTTAGSISNVNTAASDITNINTVATNISDVNTVAPFVGTGNDVTVVAAEINNNNLQTVADDIQNVIDVANDLNEANSDIEIVAGAIDNVDTVGQNIIDVNTVAGIDADVTTVAGINTDVTNVSGISTDVTTVSGISANVTTTANNDANITTVANNNTNVTTVANSIGDVNTVAGISSDVTTAAQNTEDFNDRYLGPESSEPSTDNDGDALQPGALYFDTTLDELRVYDGSQWLSTGYNSANVNITGGTISVESLVASGEIRSEEEYTQVAQGFIQREGTRGDLDVDLAVAIELNLIGFPVAGGYYAGLIDTTGDGSIQSNDDYQSGQRYALIVSPKDLEGGRGASPASGLPSGDLEWDTQDRSGEAGCFTRWNGLEATNVIIAKDEAAYEAHGFIADVRSQYPAPSTPGGSEWYLPAMDELELLYRNFKPNNADNRDDTRNHTFPGTQVVGTNPSSAIEGFQYENSPRIPDVTFLDLFKEGNAQSLDQLRYWSTTDADEEGRAWLQHFTSGARGGQAASPKDRTTSMVRPVRRVVLYDSNDTKNRSGNYNINGSITAHGLNTDGGDVSFTEDTGTTPKFVWDASAEQLDVDGTLNVDSGTLFVDSANNRVGVGTSSPDSVFEVVNSDVRFTGDGAGAAVYLSNQGKDRAASIRSNFNSLILESGDQEISSGGITDIQFKLSGSEAARIDSDGNLLVGMSSNSTLNTGFYTQPDGFFYAGRDNNTVAILDRKSSDGDIVEFRKDGSTVGSIGTKFGGLVIGTTDQSESHVRFLNNQIIPATSDGSFKDASIDLGRDGSRFKDLYLSGGVYLGGTGSDNYLDDYEEGSYVPSITDDNGSVTLRSASQWRTLQYTKVGRLVTVVGQLNIESDPVGRVNISLPFAVNGFDGSNPGSSVFVRNATKDPFRFFIQAIDGTSEGRFTTNSGGDYDFEAGDSMTGNEKMNLNISYFTDS